MDFETFIHKKTTKSLKTEELFDNFILRAACGQHLNIWVGKFKLQGARNLDAMQPRWYSLINAEALDRTSQEALSIWKEAQAKGSPQTHHFLEAGPTGRMIVVTCAPWLDERRFLRSLPDRSYLAFILPYRKIFHGLTNWKRREFAHWMFTAGQDEQGYEDISASLFYLETFESLSLEVGLQMKKGAASFSEGHAVIVPLSYLPGSSEELYREILRFDAQNA